MEHKSRLRYRSDLAIRTVYLHNRFVCIGTIVPWTSWATNPWDFKTLDHRKQKMVPALAEVLAAWGVAQVLGSIATAPWIDGLVDSLLRLDGSIWIDP